MSGSNIALGKPAFQKTTSFSGEASRAVDGNTNPDFYADSCTHTSNSDPSPWWCVDLEEDYFIHSVRITNRDTHGNYKC